MSNNNNANNEIPAVITTAHLLLRGLIPAFVGCSTGGDGDDNDNDNGGKSSSSSSSSSSTAGAFQMTYRKDLPKLGSAGGKLHVFGFSVGCDDSFGGVG